MLTAVKSHDPGFESQLYSRMAVGPTSGPTGQLALVVRPYTRHTCATSWAMGINVDNETQAGPSLRRVHGRSGSGVSLRQTAGFQLDETENRDPLIANL